MPIPEMTPESAKTLLDDGEGYFYVDVRTVTEFVEGHVPGAVNVPLLEHNPASGMMEPNPQFLSVMESTFARDARLILGCRSGGRSAMAVELLQRFGYGNARNMVGGFIGGEDSFGNVIRGWLALKYPVEFGDGGDASYAKVLTKSQFNETRK